MLRKISLTLPETLAGILDLHKIHPTLHAALNQTTETDATSADSDTEEEPYLDLDVYDSDDCDIPLDVASGDLLSDAEDSDAPVAALGRGQDKNTATRRDRGPAWEEH